MTTPVAFNYNISVKVDCSNTNVGSISLTLFGGSPPYTVNWIDPVLSPDIITIDAAIKTGLSATSGKPGCQVRLQCLDYALSFPQDQDNAGVYGGTLPSQRVILRTAQRNKIERDPRDTKRIVTSLRYKQIGHGD